MFPQPLVPLPVLVCVRAAVDVTHGCRHFQQRQKWFLNIADHPPCLSGTFRLFPCSLGRGDCGLSWALLGGPFQGRCLPLSSWAASQPQPLSRGNVIILGNVPPHPPGSPPAFGYSLSIHSPLGGCQ